MRALRRTPCIGICSTTYGDLVCRGCKRFAHEIVQWNAFDDAQRDIVWGRLNALREGAFCCFVRVADAALLHEHARRLRIPEQERQSLAAVGYEVLRRVVARGSDLSDFGLEALDGAPSGIELLAEVEQEFYRRSTAEYERAFHIPAE